MKSADKISRRLVSQLIRQDHQMPTKSEVLVRYYLSYFPRVVSVSCPYEMDCQIQFKIKGMTKRWAQFFSTIAMIAILSVMAQSQGISLSNRGCKTFNSNNVCLQCAPRFYFDATRICQPVSDQCKTFNELNGNCLSCYTGFRLIESACLPDSLFGNGVSDVNCRRFDNNVCLECSQGFFFNQNRVCEQVDPNCKDFNPNNGDCTDCFTGFQLESGSCVERLSNSGDPNCRSFQNNICVECSQGFFFNRQRQCQKIDDNCKTFNFNFVRCQECFEGWSLNVQFVCTRTPTEVQDPLCKTFNQGTCVECAQKAFFNFVGNCQAVNPSCKTFRVTGDIAICTSCFDGFELQSGQCLQADQSNLDPFCKTFRNGICEECSFRYFRNLNGRCELVSPLCKDFNLNTGICQSCYLGFRLIGGECFQDPNVIQDALCAEFTNQRCIRCSQGSYFNIQTGLCTAVDPSCKTFNDQNGNCLSCYTAFLLINGNCIVDDNFQVRDPFCAQFNGEICIRCSNRYYFGPNQQCMQASDFCATFSQLNGACLSCYLGYQLQNGQCQLIPDGGQISDLNCASFNANGICLRCSSRFYFDFGRVCQPVSPLCKAFNQNNGRCTECYTGFTLVNGGCIVTVVSTDPLCRKFQQNRCVECSAGSQIDFAGVCRITDGNCQNFDQVSRVCVRCFRGFIIVNGICQQNIIEIPLCKITNQDGSRCNECSQGSFLIVQTGLCREIDPNCADFNIGTQTCNRCFQGFSVVANVCTVIEIPTLGSTDPNCQLMNANSACISCFDRFFISSQGLCEKVNDLCATYNPVNGFCTSCIVGFLINGGCALN